MMKFDMRNNAFSIMHTIATPRCDYRRSFACASDFIERQIRLPSNQRKQKRRVRFQRRDAAPARLGSDASGRLPALHPFESDDLFHASPLEPSP
jgi:hypothetical protein